MLTAFFFRVRSSKYSALDLFQFIATKRTLPSDPLIQDPHTNNLTPIFWADLSSNGDLWPSIAPRDQDWRTNIRGFFDVCGISMTCCSRLSWGSDSRDKKPCFLSHSDVNDLV